MDDPILDDIGEIIVKTMGFESKDGIDSIKYTDDELASRLGFILGTICLRFDSEEKLVRFITLVASIFERIMDGRHIVYKINELGLDPDDPDSYEVAKAMLDSKDVIKC